MRQLWKLSKVSRVAIAWIAAASVGCATSTEEAEGQVDETPSAETQRRLAQQPSFVDKQGRTWVRQGEVSYRDAPLVEPKDERASEPSRDLTALTVEEAAAMLAPRMELSGVEFQLDKESALEFARAIQEVARERRELDAAGLSGEPSVGPDRGLGSTSQGIILGAADDRVNLNASADVFPFNAHGWHGTTSDPWCTCFKMINQFTCVTAAHCQHDGTSWITRRQISFQPTKNPLTPVLPAGCYARSVPAGWNGSTRDLDYAVIQLRGAGGAWCDPAGYSMGWLGWNTVGNGEANIQTWVSGFPFNDLPPSWTYPTLAYDTRTSSQPTSAAGQLRHTQDTTGGQSGTAVIKTFGPNDWRTLGVHWGATGGENSAVRMTSALATWFTTNAGF